MDRDLTGLVNETFPAGPDEIPLYPVAGQQRVLTALKQDVAEGRHLLCLAGPPGSGKTVLLRALRRDFEQGLVGLVEQPTPHNLLTDVAKSLQLDTTTCNETALRRRLVMLLSMAEQRRQPIIQIVDRAELLSAEDLDLLLHFFPRGHATLILAGDGSPEAWPAVGAAAERVARIDNHYRPDPLSAEETAGYIRHRLLAARLPVDLFEPAAIDAIHRQSEGFPGRINRLGAEALAQSAAQGEDSVSAPVVEQTRETEARLPEDDNVVRIDTAPVLARRRRSVLPVRSVVPPSAAHYPGHTAPVQVRRLQRQMRRWRAAAILAGLALIAILARELPMDNMSIGNSLRDELAALFIDLSTTEHATRESSPSPAPAGSTVPRIRPAVETPDATARGSEFASLDTSRSGRESGRQPPVPDSTAPGSGADGTPRRELPADPPPAETPAQEDAVRAKSAAPPDAEIMEAKTSAQAPAPAEVEEEAKAKAAPAQRPDGGAGDAEPAAPPASVTQTPALTRPQRAEIARLYAKRAEYEWRNGQLQAAYVSVQRGLSSDPGNARLLAMQARLREMLQRP